MENIKTAISLQKSLFQQAEQMANELKISRSRLFALAVEKFIHDYESRKMLETLNEIYADGPDLEDRRLLDAMRPHLSKLLENDEW
ncbi:hypothetical protein BH10CHL1_BH10CHL1_17110 [soil metagenome]